MVATRGLGQAGAMTTTPPEAPHGPDPREAPDDQGPRVSAAEVRDLSRLRRVWWGAAPASTMSGPAHLGHLPSPRTWPPSPLTRQNGVLHSESSERRP